MKSNNSLMNERKKTYITYSISNRIFTKICSVPVSEYVYDYNLRVHTGIVLNHWHHKKNSGNSNHYFFLVLKYDYYCSPSQKNTFIVIVSEQHIFGWCWFKADRSWTFDRFPSLATIWFCLIQEKPYENCVLKHKMLIN